MHRKGDTVAMPKPTGLLDRPGQSDTFWYTAKTKLLGPPLVNEQLGEQRLSKPLALGVLSPDGISSSAYGTEEILIALIPMAGLAAFTLILPMTLVILFVMTLVVLSYREIVMVYIRPGGSYVVARENFGPRIAQVCAVALLIDYVVTVAVQVAAGTAAVASAIPAVGPYKLEICIGVVVLMAFGNLRGLKEAGRSFAVPTYLFSGSVILMIVVGLIREAMGNLHTIHTSTLHGTYTRGARRRRAGQRRDDLHPAARVRQRRRVADRHRGGQRRGRRVQPARRAATPARCSSPRASSSASWWPASPGSRTPPTPRRAWLGYPTVLAQEAKEVFGSTFIGHLLFLLVQLATTLILYTGANTSFNGFPFLTSYVAGDSFLPRWLLKRGHRLVFSNAIILLTVTALALLIIKDADVNSLVPLYAIGVFTAFSMAGFGMAKYHTTHSAPGWRPKFIINFSAGVLTLIVVIIFAVVKFTEGAWVVLVLFAILVPALIRLNTEYRAEAEVLETVTGEQPPPPPHYSRRVVFVLVDSFDLATLAALRYARSLRPTQIRAVHFVIDSVRAEKLRDKWTRADRGVALDFIDCPDRRLIKAADRPGRARGRGHGHARHRDPAPAQLLGAARPAAARPHRRQDRRRGQPHPPLGRHHRPLRRAQPGRRPAGAPGGQVDRRQRGRQGGQGRREGPAARRDQRLAAARDRRTARRDRRHERPATRDRDTAVEQAASAAELAREGDVAAAHSLFSKPGLVDQARRHRDRRRQRRQGRGGGEGPGGGDPPGRAELGARGGDQRHDRQPHRDVLRPIPHPRADLRRAGQVHRLGRAQGRPSGDDQPRLRAGLPRARVVPPRPAHSSFASSS